MDLRSSPFYADNQVIAVVCNQWGDTGKGKIIDLLAAYWLTEGTTSTNRAQISVAYGVNSRFTSDTSSTNKTVGVVIRGTGGNNAGHTIVLPNGEKITVHLIPSGILHENVLNVMGNGMVVNLDVLLGEIEDIHGKGHWHQNLMLSKDAYLIFPFHKYEDGRINGIIGISTTGMGIGPAYTDKAARVGIKVADLFHKGIVMSKLEQLAEVYKGRIADVPVDEDDPKNKETKKQDLGEYIHSKKEILLAKALIAFSRVREFVGDKNICDTDEVARTFYNAGKRILLEGAQGTLLDIVYGTVPFSTSSGCCATALASGAGMPAGSVNIFRNVLGVVKAPFMTRVGAGPFPSEIGGEDSERYCEQKGHGRLDELEEYLPGVNEKDKEAQRRLLVPLINRETNPLTRSILLRMLADEYGATTGRPRRVGALDLVALSYAAGINGPNIAITKPDIMEDILSIPICVRYAWDGPETQAYAGKLSPGNSVTRFFPEPYLLRHCKPVLNEFSSYSGLRDAKSVEDMHLNFMNMMESIQGMTGTKIQLISTGPERDKFVIK